ncbi:MAG: DUF488 family protein [Acidimicrobiales bacterium]|nr:DUF488 family protein [Acidimicrobiales bacterium]
MADASNIEVHRVYEDHLPDAGHRVLVDRLWPRGVAKADLHLDEWCKDVAPSTDLRRWYGHDPDRFEEFAGRYRDELAAGPASEAVARLVAIAGSRPLLLLTATRAVEISGAEVLRRHLEQQGR